MSDMSGRYIVKPDPLIVMVSTLYAADGLFDINGEGTRNATIILEYILSYYDKP
jgi:hypothetical protein